MPAAEKMLVYFLNYTYDEKDGIFGKTIIRTKNAFLNYWKKVDEDCKTNYIRIIKELYMNKEKKSLDAVAKSMHMSLQLLAWNRDGFINIFMKLIYKGKDTDKLYPIA